MTKSEAAAIMTDVALGRKPHSRNVIQLAKEVLEPSAGPGPIDATDAAHRDKAAAAAQVQANDRLARANADLNAAQARADDAKSRAAAAGKPASAPASEPVLAEI